MTDTQTIPSAWMQKYQLINERGEHVATVKLPNPEPGIVVLGGLYFHLVSGRYVQATVWHHYG
jgi:hypothetical protein